MKAAILFLTLLIAEQSVSTRDAGRKKAEEIIECAVKAKGGREAILTKTARRFQGYSMTSDGILIRDQYWVLLDGSYYYSALASDMTQIEAGSDGETYWTDDSGHATIYEEECLQATRDGLRSVD